MTDLKKMYTTLLGDSFPMEMTISFGGQTLVYRKKTWKIPMADGTVDERGLRYGENPDQDAHDLFARQPDAIQIAAGKNIKPRRQFGGHAQDLVM